MKDPAYDYETAVLTAARYLESAGFRILDSAWRAPGGHLEIVAADRHVFVVCQVKTRSGTRYGTPLEVMGRAKLRRLRKLAVAWLNAHGMRFEQVRIDIVRLTFEGPGGYTTEHVQGVG